MQRFLFNLMSVSLCFFSLSISSYAAEVVSVITSKNAKDTHIIRAEAPVTDFRTFKLCPKSDPTNCQLLGSRRFSLNEIGILRRDIKSDAAYIALGESVGVMAFGIPIMLAVTEATVLPLLGVTAEQVALAVLGFTKVTPAAMAGIAINAAPYAVAFGLINKLNPVRRWNRANAMFGSKVLHSKLLLVYNVNIQDFASEIDRLLQSNY